jgi:hypothetical protein
MKTRKRIVLGTLKLIGYVLGCFGALAVIGVAGDFMQNSITFSQYLVREFLAFMSIFAAFAVYVFRNALKS